MRNFFKKEKSDLKQPLKKKTKENQMSAFYKKAFIFFGLGSMLLFLSPLVTGTEYSIDPTPIGKLQPITDKIQVKFVKAVYNPENQLFRIDFEIQTDVNNPTLVNLDYDAYAKIIGNTKKSIPGEIIQVNQKYLVIFFNQIPKDYEAIGITLKPSYIESDIVNDPHMKDRKVFTNFLQKDIPEDSSLMVESTHTYQKDWISAKQENLNDEIQKQEKKIRISRIKIENAKKTLADTKNDTNLMTDDEVREYARGKQSLQNSIAQEEGNIKKAEEALDKLKERMDHYEKEKQLLK